MQSFIVSLVFAFTFATVNSNVIKPENSHANVDLFAIDDCWYKDFMCKTDTDKVPEVGDFDTPEKCQAHCVDDLSDVECKYWAFKKLGSNPAECYALTECEHDSSSHCTPSITDNSHCASGPRACANPCPTLTYEAGYKTHWSCIHVGQGISPYLEDIPDASVCTAECPAWTDAVTAENHKVSSTCTNGAWGPVTPAVTPTVEPPDTNPNPVCTCNSIKIDCTKLDPGAEIFCTDESGEGDLILQQDNLEIKPGMQCIMLCDKQFVLEVSCNGGVWSKGITDCTNFYCWNEPADESDCNWA